MLKLYQILTIILAPLIRFYLLKRKARGKEDPLRFNERLGIASIARPTGKLAWVHAASAGESISILPLIDRLSEKFPDLHFLITSGTVNSASVIAGRLPHKAIHQYVPVDVLCYVKRFLAHWQPNIAIFVESEIWPNLITQTGKTCPLIMVNGHISKKSFESWEKAFGFSKTVLGAFSMCLAQSNIDAEYLKKLGAKNIINTGNIKYDAPPLPADSRKLSELSSMIGKRHIWVAASTHNEGTAEERIIAKTHQQLKEIYPDILTIIVPRHSSRTSEILSELASLNLQIKVRSKDEPIENSTDIYLADTMGELGIFYRLANIVFVGGSLVARGGHNPLEPARLGCVIIIGPYSFNFTEINQEFEEKNAIITVQNQEDLTKEIISLINDKEKTSRYITSALEVVNEKTGILDKVITEIAPYI